VAFYSVKAAVEGRDDRGDHLMLPPLQRQIGR
jgi:hypothetical protein